MWLSLVEYSVRDAGVGGSNPLIPTTYSTDFRGIKISLPQELFFKIPIRIYGIPVICYKPCCFLSQTHIINRIWYLIGATSRDIFVQAKTGYNARRIKPVISGTERLSLILSFCPRLIGNSSNMVFEKEAMIMRGKGTEPCQRSSSIGTWG